MVSLANRTRSVPASAATSRPERKANAFGEAQKNRAKTAQMQALFTQAIADARDVRLVRVPFFRPELRAPCPKR
jgi:hypothetical protein